jgi:ABC-type spermidine/putrescine transport system permease subunit I
VTADLTERPRVVTPGKLVVWVVAALWLAVVTWMAVGNFVGVSRSVADFNAFVHKNGGTGLETSTPWVALVLDVAIAPVAFVVAWVVSRRMDLVRTVVVFVVALCAVSALWFTLLQYVGSTLRIGS